MVGARGTTLKAFLRFSTLDGGPVLTKVGISAVSIEGARKNLAAEMNDWDFDRVVTDASRVWNAELNKIAADGGTETQLTNFYTALYHAMIAPNLFMDVDGQYARDFRVHSASGFDNYKVFSLWTHFALLIALHHHRSEANAGFIKRSWRNTNGRATPGVGAGCERMRR